MCKSLPICPLFGLEQISEVNSTASIGLKVSLVLHEKLYQIPLEVYPLSAGGKAPFCQCYDMIWGGGSMGTPFFVYMDHVLDLKCLSLFSSHV